MNVKPPVSRVGEIYATTLGMNVVVTYDAFGLDDDRLSVMPLLDRPLVGAVYRVGDRYAHAAFERFVDPLSMPALVGYVEDKEDLEDWILELVEDEEFEENGLQVPVFGTDDVETFEAMNDVMEALSSEFEPRPSRVGNVYLSPAGVELLVLGDDSTDGLVIAAPVLDVPVGGAVGITKDARYIHLALRARIDLGPLGEPVRTGMCSVYGGEHLLGEEDNDPRFPLDRDAYSEVAQEMNSIGSTVSPLD